MNDLPRSEGAERAVDLSDVNGDTAHTIVHFLYTGQYQTLPNGEEETASNHSKADFKKAIATFIAAKKYGLITLKELAKDTISECAESITVTQAAHGIGKETLTALQEDAGWLQDLVLHKVEQTFNDNDEIFSSASFFSGIKSLKLARLCGLHVARLYHVQTQELGKRVSELEEAVAKQYEILKNCHGTDRLDEPVPAVQSNQATTAEDATPLLPPEDQITSSDWGFFGSTKEKKKKTEIFADFGPSEPVTEPIAEFMAESVAEPVMEAPSADDIAPAASAPIEEVTEADVDRADVASLWASFGTGVSKKKKKKGRKTAVVDEAPALEPNIPSQALEVSEPSSAFVEFTSSNMRQEPSIEPIEVIADVIPAATAVIEDSPVIVEPPLTNEQEDPWSWGAALGSDKKRRKKKGKAAQIEPPPSPPPALSAPDEKLGEDLIEPETAQEPDPGLVSSVDNDAPGIVVGASEDGTCCTFRYEHLSQSDGWRDCSKCEAYMRKIAIKLQTAGLLDVNGLVAM